MLWQIKKVLHGHFPDLPSRISAFNDPRKGIQYTVEEVVMAAVVLFLLQCKSRNSFNHKSKDNQFSDNYYRLFRLRLPHMDAVNDLFEKMSTEELSLLRSRLIGSLIEKRVFHKFRFFSNCFCIAIDGTGVYSWGDNPPGNLDNYALRKESSKGRISWSSYILEAVLVCNNGMSIPLLSEWIANDGQEYDKQDCELKAFKRLAVRLKSCFPRLPVCLLVDGLYTNKSLMDICTGYGWKFITVFKDGNLSSVHTEVESLLLLNSRSVYEQTLADSNNWYIYRYRWLNDIEYQNHNINWMRCDMEIVHRKTGDKTNNKFEFLTNLDVNRNKVVALLQAGRARWNIEDHFNTQKNRGGELHHKFSRINFNAIKNWHNIRQIASIVKELAEFTQKIRTLLKENAKMSLRELYENLNAFLYMCCVKEVITEFEHWSKLARQVRLE